MRIIWLKPLESFPDSENLQSLAPEGKGSQERQPSHYATFLRNNSTSESSRWEAEELSIAFNSFMCLGDKNWSSRPIRSWGHSKPQSPTPGVKALTRNRPGLWRIQNTFILNYHNCQWSSDPALIACQSKGIISRGRKHYLELLSTWNRMWATYVI